MRASRLLLFLGVLTLAALVLPAGAAAKPGYIRLPGYLSFQLQLGDADGYALSAVGGGGRVFLTASRGATSASYAARGFANRHRLEVDLGRFGRIAVRLERSPRVTHRRFGGSECHGRPAWQLHGVASGRIRFRGLRGFVAIDKRRAKAEVVRSFETVCKRGPGSTYVVVTASRDRPGRAAPGPHLQLRADTLEAKRRGGESIEFVASRLSLIGETTWSISATTSQRLDGVEIWNTASRSLADSDRLAITRRGVYPATATVVGSGPFSGEATYRQLDGGRSEWSGSLQVELPGEGAVPLAGPGFHAQICHGSFAKAFGGCPAQSSGSHSQSLFDARLSWSR